MSYLVFVVFVFSVFVFLVFVLLVYRCISLFFFARF